MILDQNKSDRSGLCPKLGLLVTKSIVKRKRAFKNPSGSKKNCNLASRKRNDLPLNELKLIDYRAKILSPPSHPPHLPGAKQHCFMWYHARFLLDKLPETNRSAALNILALLFPRTKLQKELLPECRRIFKCSFTFDYTLSQVT
jgi:hypothetical protein